MNRLYQLCYETGQQKDLWQKVPWDFNNILKNKSMKCKQLSQVDFIYNNYAISDKHRFAGLHK